MLFSKHKFVIQTRKGKGRFINPPWRGIINNLIVLPKKTPFSYDFKILDSEEDPLFHIKRIRGRLDYNEGIVIGKSQQEEMIFIVENSMRDMEYTVILLIKER